MPASMQPSEDPLAVPWRRRALGWARSIWLAVGLALLALAAAEGAARLALWLLPRPPADPRLQADSYPPKEPWVAELYQESARSARLRWEPYVYWRRLPFAGRYVNIDARGLRRTWRLPAPTAPGAARRPRVFFFGGSDVWGTGVRDDHTLPSELARWLAAAGVDAEVENYGETGYVSTQSVITLLRELQRGNVPDLVVLYVGANDAIPAVQAHAAGLPQNEAHRAAEFNLLRHPRRLALATLAALVANSALERLAQELRPPPGAAPGQVPPGAALDQPAAEGTLDPLLAADILRTLDAGVTAAQALCAAHGCRAVACWGPNLLDKPHRTPYEETRAALLATIRDGVLTVEQDVQRDWAAKGSGDRVFLGDLFASTTAPRFIDAGHASETANREIAAAIGRHLLDHHLLAPLGPDRLPPR
jgi:lysophospholipase L1-like esterase